MAYTLSDVQPKIVNGVVVELSDAEKQATVDEWNAADTRPYYEKRIEEYASIEDQLDMQYWDNVNSTTTWKDHVAAVKAAHPKS